ncbi:MAG: methylated-DNA-[protein]-cysteine S-methyltransferase [Alphaproteobacteria bacterium]|nr:methylated-DNA-[protein]-cysteine S-methyltransferase [Alphaproteobacteria bacterium]
MTDPGFTLFDTAIGRCGIAWNGRGIVAAQLPETDEAKTRARLLRRCPQAREEAPPPAVRQVIDRIVALLAGEAADLSDVALDMEGVPPFNRGVYEVARTIPPGQTLTYGEIAARLGAPDARAVGQALGENPFPPVVPCHRVVAAGGKTGGFSAPGGVDTKLRLLAIEGAQVGGSCPLFDRPGEVLPMQARPRRAAR